MSKQIIKQPNGKYCIFSSVTDNIFAYEATREELLETLALGHGEAKRIFQALDQGRKPYAQFTMSYSEMLEWIETVHGAKKAQETKSEIEGNLDPVMFRLSRMPYENSKTFHMKLSPE